MQADSARVRWLSQFFQVSLDCGNPSPACREKLEASQEALETLRSLASLPAWERTGEEQEALADCQEHLEEAWRWLLQTGVEINAAMAAGDIEEAAMVEALRQHYPAFSRELAALAVEAATCPDDEPGPDAPGNGF